MSWFWPKQLKLVLWKGDLHPGAKVTPISEHFQHFVEGLTESFWGDLQGRVRQSAEQFFALLSERQRDRYTVSRATGGGRGGRITAMAITGEVS